MIPALLMVGRILILLLIAYAIISVFAKLIRLNQKKASPKEPTDIDQFVKETSEKKTALTDQQKTAKEDAETNLQKLNNL